MEISSAAFVVAALSLMLNFANYRRGNARVKARVTKILTIAGPPADIRVTVRLSNLGLAEIDVRAFSMWFAGRSFEVAVGEVPPIARRWLV